MWKNGQTRRHGRFMNLTSSHQKSCRAYMSLHVLSILIISTFRLMSVTQQLVKRRYMYHELPRGKHRHITRAPESHFDTYLSSLTLPGSSRCSPLTGMEKRFGGLIHATPRKRIPLEGCRSERFLPNPIQAFRYPFDGPRDSKT